MTQTYEGMFLLDNQVVREDWNKAKAVVTDLLAKHGATVLAARRWDERKLAYPIKGRLRATYLISYFQIPAENLPAMTRDFNLDEVVLRYIQLSVDGLPEGEAALAEAENAADFSIPAPPPDDAPDPVDERDDSDDDSDDDGRGRRRERRGNDDEKATDEKATDDSSSDAEAQPAAATTEDTKQEG